MTADAAVLLPVKAFASAKGRLSPRLDAEARERLARQMADRTVAAARGLPVFVVCRDPSVADWARGLGADVIDDPGRGLNAAVARGVAHLESLGLARVIVAHADLPFADDLRPLARFAGITLVPDRREDGTNIVSLPRGCGFTFAYGPGSFARHRAAALRTGLPVRVWRRPALAWDVDEPDDLTSPTGGLPEGSSPPTGGALAGKGMLGGHGR